MHSRVGSYVSFEDSDDETALQPIKRDQDPREQTTLLNPNPPLSWKTIVLYALAPLGVDTASVLVGFFYTTFLLEVAKLEPAYSGFVFLAGQISDAISAPAIGRFTDNTNTRLGRRRPWLLITAIPASLIFICLWHTWVSEQGQFAMFIYYTVLFIMWNMFANCIIVPLGALTPDLVYTYDEATKLTEGRVIIYTFFSIIAVVGHSLMIEMYPLAATPLSPSHNDTSNTTSDVFDLVYTSNSTTYEADYIKGYSTSIIIWASIFAIFPIISGIFIHEKQRSAEQIEADTTSGVWENLKDLLRTFTSPNFLYLTLMYFLCWTSAQLVQNNLFLYVKYVMKQESNFMYLVLVILSLSAPAAFLWGKLSNYVGKRNTYLIGSSQWVLVMVALYFIDYKLPLWSHYILAASAGICIGVAFLLPWSMLPDVIDEDEWRSGKRSEGSFYSIFILVQKLGAATALGSSNWVLGLAGYDGGEPGSPPPLTQPETVLTALKFMSGPVCAVMIFLSMIPMIFYKLDKSRVLEIRRELNERPKLKVGLPKDEDETFTA
eukprot:TRINITY_DN7185_c0_g2_i1.p1 TRINITY_DN7185_c0_g2~~TRINITY_DN7185_c0_g2_i1.p1  ORF type:complete len:547 (-),score=80.68 TRINITY_DN7185_c0_g2_i1:38-1678(-)